MVKRRDIAIVVAGTLFFALLAGQAQAREHSERSERPERSRHTSSMFSHSNHYPAYGRVAVDLPGGFFSLSLGNVKFYYSDGIFYNRRASHYVVVPPPAGAHVAMVPVEYTPIVINGVTYYTYEGRYYQATPSGYAVVPTPDVTVNGSGDSFTVNIPNDRGGYTPVAIRRSGRGFIGPQGEYYSEFPAVAQLRLMYGR